MIIAAQAAENCYLWLAVVAAKQKGSRTREPFKFIIKK
jgi:hypothetical protein